MNGGRGIGRNEWLWATAGIGRLPCNGTGRAGPSAVLVIIPIEGIGSSGTGELGAEYRLFILILAGGVPVSFRDRKKAGVDMRIFGGRARGGRIGLGDSDILIFFTDDLGVGSLAVLGLFFFFSSLPSPPSPGPLFDRFCDPSGRLFGNRLFGFLNDLALPSFPLSSVG
jgi:hypothetical protein